jgi:hypothetical protein
MVVGEGELGLCALLPVQRSPGPRFPDTCPPLSVAANK